MCLRATACLCGEARRLAVLPGSFAYGRYLRPLALAPVAIRVADAAGSQRRMSIMERYRRFRPAPDPVDKLWQTPQEFRDGRDGTEDMVPPQKTAEEEEAERILLEPRQRPPIYARTPVPQDARMCNWDTPLQPTEPRSLVVGLVGPPNAGKSSLMNTILGTPVSAVSQKVNTTTEGLRGIKTVENSQLVFIDVPGIIPSHQRQSNRVLVSKAWQGYQDCELCLLVIDVVKRPTQEVFDLVRKLCPHEDIGEVELRRRQEAIAESGAPHSWLPRPIPGSSNDEGERPPVVLVLNKIDRAEEFRWVQSREREFRDHGYFDKVFYVSAKKRQGIRKLLEYLQEKSQPRPWTYPGEMRTTLSYVEQVKHQISAMLFDWFNVDVPYKIEHQTLGWTPRLDGSLLIEHELIVADSIVARMICGVRNSLVLRLRERVSHRLGKMWGVKVELLIWVRPLKNRVSRKDRSGQRKL